tara:strand:+ start:222 stop:1187 length:966 start_codon:yes stop_codon:yes gene_type:complete
MGRCSVGRATQKYTGGGGGADLSSILAAHGDMIYADQNVEAANVSIGQTTGHVLTIISPGEVGWQAVSGATGSVGTLEQVTTTGPTTTQFVSFLNTATSLSAAGNVVVSGNVTASKFIGSGVELSGVALESDLADNVIRISNLELANGVQANLITDITTDLSSNVGRIASLESNALMTSSSTLGTIQSGDLLYGAGTDSLSRLGIGSSGTVLTVDNSGMPSWQTSGGGSLWNQDGTKLYYTGGPVGIANTEPLTTQTLQVGSNVSIDDTGVNKMVITGNAYLSKSLTVVDDIDVNDVHARKFFVKNVTVVAERPVKRGVIL